MTADPPVSERYPWLAPPDDTPLYMYPAWVSALSAALEDDNIMEHFRVDTGMQWRPGKAPIERMIDEATGAYEKFFKAFVPWFNTFVWGSMA